MSVRPQHKDANRVTTCRRCESIRCKAGESRWADKLALRKL